MARDSLLKGSVWKTQSDERRTTTMAEATAERESAFGNLVILIDDQSEDISEQHTKPLDGVRAETAYLLQLHQVLENSGDRITAHFANGGADQAQPQALVAAQQRVVEVEQKLQQAEASQGRLRDEARHASNLQARLDQAEAEKTRLQRELDQARQDSDQPNPLAGRVTELEGQLSTAATEKESAEAEVTRIQGELDQANADKAAAEQSANTWHDRAIEAGYVEPGSQPDPDPAPEPKPDDHIVPGMQEPPAPTRGRRLRDRLPGHGRNQGTQDGGDE